MTIMTHQKKTAAVLSFVVLALPILAYGASGKLIPCDGPECGFSDVVKLANNIIHFLLYDVSIPLAAVGFMWAGANLILSQNKESAWSDAKGRFESIGIGFGIMLGSYVLIKVVLYAFLNTDAGFFTFLAQ